MSKRFSRRLSRGAHLKCANFAFVSVRWCALAQLEQFVGKTSSKAPWLEERVFIVGQRRNEGVKREPPCLNPNFSLKNITLKPQRDQTANRRETKSRSNNNLNESQIFLKNPECNEVRSTTSVRQKERPNPKNKNHRIAPNVLRPNIQIQKKITELFPTSSVPTDPHPKKNHRIVPNIVLRINKSSNCSQHPLRPNIQIQKTTPKTHPYPPQTSAENLSQTQQSLLNLPQQTMSQTGTVKFFNAEKG